MKILFICSGNKDRSRTAEDYFTEKCPNLEFDSAGTNQKTCASLGTNFLVEVQLQWAERVFVMETKHAEEIQKNFGSKYFRKIEILHIKDYYRYGDKELISVLDNRVDLS